MKKDEKNGSTGRTICTRSSAVASASTEQETPGLSLRRSARGTQSTSTKPVTPTSSTRRSERLASSPASVTKNSVKIEKKPTASPLRRSHKGKNVSSDKPARNANTPSSDTEESKGKAIDNIEDSTDEIKKQEPKMTGRYYRALYRGHLKKEPNASSLDDELVVVGCSRRVPAGNDDARDDNHSPHANSESKGLPAGETSLEKGPDFPVEITRDTEKMVLDSPPMVDTGDVSVIGSPSENPETQRLRDSKTSLETDIDLPLKRKRDTAEIVMDACANADDRIMSSDGVIPSPSGCTNNNQPERCGTCQKRQKVNDGFENLSVCSCIAQPVQESDHVAQDMKESGPATNRDYGENRQKMQKSYDPKFSSMYPEYWVPVQLSDVQMEQYCRNLFSKSLSLSSLSKNDLVGALEGTLTSVRKTCDHPYVTDASLKQLLTKNLKLHEILDVEVKASGKLHLLDAMLTQIKAKGLKAVVFYQATQSPEGLLLANILEDFVSQRFGLNSYEHGVCLSKKTAINNFNKESQCFILLLEARACSQSIKLSRAEAFILFGSSLNPSLDVKLLEKIKIESYSERTKIFRLYSVCTVEEKALILARQNKPLENLNRPLTHALLMWGASYLFEKLDHNHGTGTLDSGVPLEKSIKDAVIHEFSSIIASNVGEENEGKRCLLLEAKHVQGNYITDATLFGEEHVKLSDDISPNIFWAKLLGGKNPMWKYYSDTPQRFRKRVRHLQVSEETAKVGDGGNTKKKKKASDDVAVDNDERKASGKDHMGDLESSKVTTLLSSRGSASGTHENDVTGLYSMGGHISGIPEDMLAGIDWQQIPRESQRSLYAVIKPEMAKLCLSEDTASMAEKFLEYIIENHRVCKEPATTLQAFQIALSWIAASFVKQKCNREESLVRAKSELGFNCSKEEVDYIYSFLYCMKSLFLGRAQGLQLDCLGTKSVNESLSGDTVRQEKNNTKLMRSSDGEECMTEKRGSHYSSVTKDVEETISGIKKKFSKKLQKLVQTHEEKKMELMNRNADKKQKLQTSKKVEVSYIRVTCSGLSTQSLLDNLQRVEDDFQRKNDDLQRETDECLKSLEQMHEAAKKKLAEDEACWISRIENWAQTELINCAPIQSCNNKHLRGLCSSNTSKNDPDVQICNDASGEGTYADTNCMVAKGNQICDRVTSATRDEDVPSRVPEISQSFANLAKSASLESSLNREEALVSSHAGSDADNILDQQNEEACSPDELALPMPHPASVVKTRGSSESDQDGHEICPMPSSPGGKQPDPAENFQGQNVESAIEAQPAGSPMHCSPSGKQPDPAANIQGKNIKVAIEPESAESPMLSSPARQLPDPAAINQGENIETAVEPQPAGSPMPSSSAGQQPDPAEKNIEAAIEAQPAVSPMLSSPARQQPDPAANIQGENIETAVEPQPAGSPMLSSSAGQQPDPAEKNIEAAIEAQPAVSPMLSSPARQQPDPAANIQGENIETAIEPQPAGSPMPSSSAGQQPDLAEKNIEAAIEAQPAESPMLSSPARQQPDSAANNQGENIETAVEPQPAGSPMPSSSAGQQPDPAEKNIEAAIEAQPAGSPMPCSTSGKQPDPAANIQGKNIDVAMEPEPAESPMPSSPARQQPDPAANIQGENIETAIEPQPAGFPMPFSSAGQQPDLAEKNIEAAVEAQPAVTETVETGGFAAIEQVDQVACPLPSSSAGNQPDSGAGIESQDIITSAEPHIAGPGAVEIGDSAVLDQEIMGGRAQDACSLPSPLIGTQADLAANTEGQNIATVAQLHTAGSDVVETGPDASSPGNQFDAAVNIEGLDNNTTVAEPHTTGSDACEMEVAEPDAQVEQSTFADNVAPLVHEGVLEPSAGVIAPAPSLLNNATGQSAIRHVPQIPFPVFSDPFQHELEKLRRESENTKKTYEEKKSVLKAELDRKMAELQAEYQRKFHEVEAERTAKTMKIETSKNLVIMNKLLASAFLSKCTSRMASHPSGRIQQLAQRAAQVNALRNYYTASAPTLAPAPAPLQAQASSFPSSVSRSSGLPPNSMHCPMPQPRQPLISNTAPSLSASPLSATNLAVNARLVSPLPHINSYRSSSSSMPIPTTTPTSSAVPQASTYPTALSQQQEQRHQLQPNLGNGLQGSNDVVCLSDDE